MNKGKNILIIFSFILFSSAQLFGLSPRQLARLRSLEKQLTTRFNTGPGANPVTWAAGNQTIIGQIRQLDPRIAVTYQNQQDDLTREINERAAAEKAAAAGREQYEGAMRAIERIEAEVEREDLERKQEANEEPDRALKRERAAAAATRRELERAREEAATAAARRELERAREEAATAAALGERRAARIELERARERATARIELEQAKQREKEIARRQLEGAREDARRRIEQAREEERREIEELEGELDRIQKEAKQAKEKLSRLEGTQNELEELKGTNEELQRIQQELTNTQTEAAAGRISVEQLNRQIEALRQDLVNTDYALKQTQEQVSKEALGKLEFEERLEQISQQIATPIHEQIAIIENNIKTEHEKSPDKYAQINFLPILSRIEEIDKQIESATAQLTKNDKENLLNGVDTLKQELADALAKNARQLAVNIGEVVNNIDRYIKSQSHPELQFTIDEMRIKNPITNRINKELDSILQNELFFEYLNLASPGYQKNAKSEIARIANAYRLLGLSFKQYLDQLNKTNQQNYTDKTLKIEDFNNTVDVIKVMKWVIDNAYTPFQEKLGRLVDDLEELIVDFNSIMSIEKQKLYEIYRAKPGEKENTIKILQAVTDPAEGEDFLEYSEDQEDQLINIPPSIAEITQSYEEELKESAPQMPTVPATEEEEEEVSDPTGLEG